MLLRPAMIMLFLSVSSPLAFAQDDVMDKIRLLEQQIQELKALKQQQAVTEIAGPLHEGRSAEEILYLCQRKAAVGSRFRAVRPYLGHITR